MDHADTRTPKRKKVAEVSRARREEKEDKVADLVKELPRNKLWYT